MFSRSISSFPIGSSRLIRSSIEKSAWNIWKRLGGGGERFSYIIVQVEELDRFKSGGESHPIKVTLQGDDRVIPPVKFTCNAVTLHTPS